MTTFPRSKLLALFTLSFLVGCSSPDYRTANRESSGLAPLPHEINESIFQIYVARAFSWRGYFGTHPWISWKAKEDSSYTIAHVTRWGDREGNNLVVQEDLPDRVWFNSTPYILFEARGEEADRIISQLGELIESYPYRQEYRVWPGPNSNTFVDYIIRHVPELSVELPANAIGKDYLDHPYLFDKSPTGSGFQVSLFGVAGFTAGLGDGLEVNLLGLTLGVDLLSPALKLPIVGRVGVTDKPL